MYLLYALPSEDISISDTARPFRMLLERHIWICLRAFWEERLTILDCQKVWDLHAFQTLVYVLFQTWFANVYGNTAQNCLLKHMLYSRFLLQIHLSECVFWIFILILFPLPILQVAQLDLLKCNFSITLTQIVLYICIVSITGLPFKTWLPW